MEYSNLKNFVRDIEKLKEGEDILFHIWAELGPYNKVLREELTDRLRDHFGFDDSEKNLLLSKGW